MNIFRGLLWNQEPLISRGVQANYTAGPVDHQRVLERRLLLGPLQLALRLRRLGDQQRPTPSVGHRRQPGHDGLFRRLADPRAPEQRQEQLDNLIYTYTNGAWIAQAYFQYADTGNDGGARLSARTRPRRARASSSTTPSRTPAGTSPAAFEDISSTGHAGRRPAQPAVRPGQQRLVLHAHADLPVRASLHPRRGLLRRAGTSTRGAGFGPSGTSTSQTRFAIETGILF